MQYKYTDNLAIGIVTCNRQDFFNNLINSIDQEFSDKLYVVNSGQKYTEYPDNIKVHQCVRNPTVVGIAKNILLRNMLQNSPNAEWFFVLEDDITIIDNKVFDEYINTAKVSGLIHGQLSYGLHGLYSNVKQDGTPDTKYLVNYNSKNVAIYKESFAAFTLFHRSTFSNLGPNLFDERYLNAAEHLDLHHRCYKSGLGTPFWNFCDIENSHLYIKDQDPGHSKSVIRSDPEFIKNFNYSWGLFESIHKKKPTSLPDVSPDKLMRCLEALEETYSIK